MVLFLVFNAEPSFFLGKKMVLGWVYGWKGKKMVLGWVYGWMGKKMVLGWIFG
jgi:hypothetical protein